jgi:hypothetical protein
MGNPYKRLFRYIFGYSTYFKTHGAGLYSCNPEIRLALALAHSRFKRLGANRLMREDPDIDFAFTMQEVSRGNSAGLNVTSGYPTCFQGLQTVFTKCNKVASRRIAFHLAALALTVLNSFRQHRHYSHTFVKTSLTKHSSY